MNGLSEKSSNRVRYKACPRCKTPAVLTASFCAECHHRYRTQFSDTTAVPAQESEKKVLRWFGPASQTVTIDRMTQQQAQRSRQVPYLLIASVAALLSLVLAVGLGMLSLSATSVPPPSEKAAPQPSR